MIGLIYIVVGLIYVVATILLAKLAVRAAKRRGIAGWKWGLPVLLVMYLLVFWDWIPTVVAHKYYCAKDAGFTVYKTLEEWKKENPGVADTLIPVEGSKSTREGDHAIYELNQRFVWETDRAKVAFGIRKFDNSIIDKISNDVMARYVDFDTDISAIGLGTRNLRDYKSWLRAWSCEPDGGKIERKLFSEFMYLIKHGKENK